LHTNGSWDWQSYLLHGQVQPRFCEQFPITTQILQGIDDRNHLFTKNPFGFCFFSKLAGQSTIQSHASPINFRLRIHLPIIVPTATTTTSSTTPTNEEHTPSSLSIGIRVGPMTQTWIPDHAMILDDSYNHEVWNHTHEERVVLVVDVWHPDVRPKERDEITRMFQHAQQQGWLNPNHKSSS
jgi:aspartate beta-hydroxylase